jgi:hypothetical protein
MSMPAAIWYVFYHNYRMEQLASTTQEHVHAVMTASEQFLKVPQLEQLLQGCSVVQQLQQDITSLQGG